MDGCAHGRREEAGPGKDGRRGPQASPQQKHPSKHTPMKHTYEDLPPPPPQKYDTLQLLFLTTHHKNIKAYDDEFTLYKIPTYITKKRNNHHAHDKYLYRRWINPNSRKTKKPCCITPIAATSAPTPKDDLSVAHTLQTLLPTKSTHTHTSHQHGNFDTLISITIGINQQYSTKCSTLQNYLACCIYLLVSWFGITK